MALTRDFKETVQARIRRDPEFKAQLFAGAVECLIGGDLETGKGVLRDYINATMGFKELASLTGIPPKSLMRMLGPSGNPRARNLFEVTECVQRHQGIVVNVVVGSPQSDKAVLEDSLSAPIPESGSRVRT